MHKRALFVVSTRGQGHIVRCRALASELATRGWASTMTNKAPLSPASYDVSIVDLEGEEQEIDVCEQLRDRPVVAIVDTPHAVPAHFVVCGTVGARADMFPMDHPNWRAKKDGQREVWISAGPQVALLREEILERREIAERCLGHLSLREQETLDLRSIEGVSATDLAGMLFSSLASNDSVITFGGMRALEAACIRGGAWKMTIEARNPGEELNKKGLLADPERDLVDGRGCIRVANAILELVA